MAEKKIVLLIPVFIGILLIAVSQFDLWQFRRGDVEVRYLLARELPLVVTGLVATLGVFVVGVVAVFKSQWAVAAISMGSGLTFVFCFTLGGNLGAAYLNAT